MAVRGYAKGSAPGENQEGVKKLPVPAVRNAFPEFKGNNEAPEVSSLL
jgi:hypothetical protein